MTTEATNTSTVRSVEPLVRPPSLKRPRVRLVLLLSVGIGVLVCGILVAYFTLREKQATFEILEWYVTDAPPGEGWESVPGKLFVVVSLQIKGTYPMVYPWKDSTGFEIHASTFHLVAPQGEFHGEGFGTDHPAHAYSSMSPTALARGEQITPVDLRPPAIVFIVDRSVTQQEMAIRSVEMPIAPLRVEKRK